MPDDRKTICAECGSSDGQILFLAVAWPGGRTFEGHVHRNCQNELVERLEREWQIKQGSSGS